MIENPEQLHKAVTKSVDETFDKIYSELHEIRKRVTSDIYHSLVTKMFPDSHAAKVSEINEIVPWGNLLTEDDK